MINFCHSCKVNNIVYINTKINKLKKTLLDMQPKVVKVTKTDYTLDRYFKKMG